ncbi:ribonuclease HII [Flagellimonas aequoris]|uniref:Ribonuclease HII n=1 Tax=Flagellimonas aequoris TaxID=2306997 RepID=A0A418N6W8_9FLAO|nr:ribonuclease HII [Allomuricauda aequoris]RIV70466.1 ribonuclease HII [Allomuricauda aequoris]TXK01894.1 ribonuclease HII [Allomuricauda aequoris]
MRYKILFCLLTLLIVSCTKEVKIKTTLLDQLPPNPSLIVKINNLTNFKSELKNNGFLEKMKGLSNLTDILNKLNGLESLSTESTCLLALYEVGKDNYDFVLIAKKSPGLFNVEDIANKTVETLTYQNAQITKYSLDDISVFSLSREKEIVFSSSNLLVENMVRTKEANPIDPTLKKLYEASSGNKSATLFMNLATTPSVLSMTKEVNKNKSPLAEWVSLDFTANSDQVSLTGIAMAPDSTKNFINLFKGTSPLTNKTPLFSPLNAQAIISYTFDDYQVFAKNQNTYLDRIKPVDTLFNTIEEIGVMYLNNQKAVLLSSYGTESLYNYMDANKTGTETYQGSEIMELPDKKFIETSFTPLVRDFASNYCTILENSFVYAQDKETLQTIISNYKSTSSFANAPVYTTAKAPLASESSVLFVSDASGIDYFAEKDLAPEVFQSIKKADLDEHSFASQLVADHDFAHFNILVSKIGKTQENNTVTPLFTLELDTDLAIDPQFVTNHRTNKKEIVVQDRNNVLYLISTDGKVLWTKQLEGRIQPPIQQVDIYKNGRLQLAFCTNDQFMIVDRNGEDVPPFKIDFEGGNLNPLAVFDYEGKKDYRFVITQGRKVFMYNNQAKIVGGFKFTEAPSNILGVPQHFRVANKDYLVFKLEDNTLKILHRTGSDRIKVAEKIDFSNNEVFLYKNKFSVTNKTGVLHQIDTKGKLTATNFNMNKDHGMYATSNTLVFMDDNILTIKGRKVELDLGVYTKPKIFYIYDKIYVSVTDIQNQKIYLFDSQAKPIPNFPVFGSSLIDLTDMDNDKNLELVAKDQDNSLIVYKMN